MSTSAALSLQATSELDERRLQVVAEQAGRLRWQIALTAAIVAAIVWRSVPAPAVLSRCLAGSERASSAPMVWSPMGRSRRPKP